MLMPLQRRTRLVKTGRLGGAERCRDSLPQVQLFGSEEIQNGRESCGIPVDKYLEMRRKHSLNNKDRHGPVLSLQMFHYVQVNLPSLLPPLTPPSSGIGQVERREH